MIKTTWFSHFLDLFYPNLCLACGDHLQIKGDIMCVSCNYKTPQTDFHIHKENEFTEHFWGRLQLYSGAALFKFTKGGRAQELLHALKYKNKPIVGVKLGELYGYKLKESPLFSSINYIIPVPLHPRKKHRRGYNQSAQFARGLASSMKIATAENILRRNVYTETQTKKSRIERMNNVANVFELFSPQKLENKHLLLVDDVITTGATLEACANKLLTIKGVQISMATIAIAR